MEGLEPLVKIRCTRVVHRGLSREAGIWVLWVEVELLGLINGELSSSCGTFTLVSILVTSKSLRSVELSWTVKALEKPRRSRWGSSLGLFLGGFWS